MRFRAGAACREVAGVSKFATLGRQPTLSLVPPGCCVQRYLPVLRAIRPLAPGLAAHVALVEAFTTNAISVKAPCSDCYRCEC